MSERIDLPTEQELYVEPQVLRRKDIAGVILALVALSVIGLAGYVFMTPGMSFGKLFGADRTVAAVSPAAEPAAGAGTAATEEARCPYCGMFASRSMSHVTAAWGDGSHGHFDSWDCTFNYGAEGKLKLLSAKVIDYASSLEAPVWLDAKQAFYLYDTTKSVAGSMLPYTAALSDRAAAESAQQEMGGELLDFAGLAAKWSAPLDAIDDAAPTDSPGAGTEDSASDSEQTAAGEEAAAADSAEAEQGTEPASASIGHTAHSEGGELACPYCGMLATNSGTHVVSAWGDGTHHHYDCFDCMFQHAKESSATISQVMVSRYGTSPGEVDWLNADSAVFLYDTKRIKGSMPTYVAAFASRADAEAAQPELGGEILSWAELRARWEQQ